MKYEYCGNSQQRLLCIGKERAFITGTGVAIISFFSCIDKEISFTGMFNANPWRVIALRGGGITCSQLPGSNIFFLEVSNVYPQFIVASSPKTLSLLYRSVLQHSKCLCYGKSPP
jgi:hypothetical protein